MKRATREWVKKAEEDYVLARQGSRSKIPVHNGVCFHCQQCAEKYLKALMEERGLFIPKTHDLDQLLTVIVPHHPPLRTLRRGIVMCLFQMNPTAGKLPHGASRAPRRSKDYRRIPRPR